VADRFAELVGLGCTQHETAREVGIGASTGERLLTRPEYRAIADRARRERSGVTADLAHAIKALLAAKDEAGQPNRQPNLPVRRGGL
jgi:hypothetical protein